MSTTVLQGSCLCGSVVYEIQGEPTRFYHCHCRRCRKATGTGHASNVMVANGILRWLRGESLLKTFRVPEAKRFTRQFCGHCGSAVPRLVAETGFIVIPAGSIDSDIPMQPQARIFWDSRAPWSCGGDDIPVYAQYPGP
ncbi:MAG: GFA family protein [Gammaproteobacteria bacterium]|nr:GFA family protein [Gammaproteobacteria bacterium]